MNFSLNFPLTSENPGTAEAVRLQKELSGKLDLNPSGRRIRFLAGCDVSFASGLACGYVCVYGYPRLELEAEASCVSEALFPYVPGLLSFREAPPLLECVRKLEAVPDLFLFDGHGISHPRRFGLASHMGLVLGRPSIGCAKSRLCGFYREPGPQKGDFSMLRDGAGIPMGAALRTRSKVKPVFVSQGNLISLEKAVETVLACTGAHRIPEPLRRAHSMAKEKLRSFIGKPRVD